MDASTFWDRVAEILLVAGEPLGDIIDALQTLDPLTRALMAGAAAMLETNVVTGLFVPGDTVMLLASASVQSVSEGVLLAVLVSAGALIGEIVGYWLGRWVGQALGRGRWLRRSAGEQRIGVVARMVENRGGPWILASRFIPVLRTVTPFVIGIHLFPFRRFLAWSAPTCVLWSAVFVTLYGVASSSIRGDDPILGGVLATLGVVLFGIAVLAQRLIERRHSSAGMAEQEGQEAA